MRHSTENLMFNKPGKTSDVTGATASIRICDFKMKSDSVAVPSINLDDVSLNITFKLTIILSFSVTTKKWSADGDDFRVDILDFNGPFVLTKGVMSAVMGLAVPIIRENVLKDLPQELGLFISSIPLPLSINGTFSVDGDLTLDSVFNHIFMSESICKLFGYSSQQLLNFNALQKSLGRPKILVSMMDLMRYKRRLEKYEDQWSRIQALWDEAALIYFSQTVRLDPATTAQSSGFFRATGPGTSRQDFGGFLSFDKLLLGADKVRKNELHFRFDLKNIEGQIGLKNGITNLHAYFMRIIEQVSANVADLSPSKHSMLADATNLLCELTKKFQLILKHMDHVHNKVKVHIKTGPGGFCDLSLKDFSAQAPVVLWASLPRDHIISLDYFIVPTLVRIKTSKTGSIETQMFHMGCNEMMERKHFNLFFEEYESKQVGIAQEALVPLRDNISDVEVTGYSTMGAELVSSCILRPHIAFVVDKAINLQAGSELFTINVGPLDEELTPTGVSPDDRSYKADIQPSGEACPLLMQTSDQVKLLVKSPAITSRILLEPLVRYLDYHFANVDMLLELLSQVSEDVESNMQIINFSSLLVSLLKKYVKMPNLDMRLDISVNMISNAGDVIVCIENRQQDSSAMMAHAVANIAELVKDTSGLKTAFLNSLI